jgi:hypothetical protein
VSEGNGGMVKSVVSRQCGESVRCFCMFGLIALIFSPNLLGCRLDAVCLKCAR